MGRRLLACALAVAFAVTAPAARAENKEAKKAFLEGKKKRDEGNCTAAIPAFERSLSFEESVGAYYNLGYCYEQTSQRQDAFVYYKKAQRLADAKKDDRYAEIGESVASLEANADYVRLTLPTPLPNGIQIVVDGIPVPERYYDAETTVFTDRPAPHTVVVSAPGYEDTRIEVRAKVSVPIVLQKPRPKTDPPPPPPPRTETKTGWTWHEYVGLGLVIVGAAGATYGAVEGIVYLNARSDSDKELDRITRDYECKVQNNQLRCRDGLTQEQRDDRDNVLRENQKLVDDESAARLRSILPMAIGLTAVGFGVVLFVTAPKTEAPPTEGRVQFVPIVSSRQQGFAIVGTF